MHVQIEWGEHVPVVPDVALDFKHGDVFLYNKQ